MDYQNDKREKYEHMRKSVIEDTGQRHFQLPATGLSMYRAHRY